jgi:aminoglycoside phosphotransferase (APT) family kinase protein
MAKLSPNKLKKTKEMAVKVIKAHIGKEPVKVIHQPTGLTNFVFEVELPKEKLIVRISNDHSKFNDYLKEQWAIAHAKKIGIPVAEILEVGNSVIPFPYMVQRKIEGTNGQQSRNRLSILQQMGELTAKINSIKTNDFGVTFDWSENKLTKNKTWKDYLQNELKVDECISILKKNKMIGAAKLKKLLPNLRKIEKWNDRPVLNHGDMRLKNTIADNKGKIVAILDWEKCCSNIAPYWDLSHAMHDLGIDEMETFIKGYGLSSKKFSEISYAIKTFNMLNYAIVLKQQGVKKDNKLIQEYKLRFSGSYDLFSL